MSASMTSSVTNVERRDLMTVTLLLTVTLTLYGFYLVYQWAKDLSQLTGKDRNPGMVLLVSILTLGVAPLIYEYVFASEAAALEQQRFPKRAPSSLPTWILILNCSTLLCCLTVVLAPLALVLGVTASVLVQHQFNRLVGE
ncbi:MAG: DUF4234 domain-containing protein [Pirellulaceae bacterium]